MYVRLARFEGAESISDETIAEVRERMKEGMSQSETPVKRGMMLVDRENGRGASLMFCETEDDRRKVDEYMNAMAPHSRAGTRVGVEMYEIAVDSDEL
jgi:predicted DNA-binding protein (UPF0278 family)